MSARRVCSGKRPCRYHSERAISLPFRRPLTRTLIPLQPQRNFLRPQLRIELRLVHFLNVDKDIPIGALLDVLLQLVDLRSLAADDDPRTRGADDDAQLVARTLDVDGANASRLQLFLQLGFQLHVFQQQLVVVAHYKPTRPPVLGNAQTESVWMDFLSHSVVSSPRRPHCGIAAFANLYCYYFFLAGFLAAGFFAAGFFLAGAFFTTFLTGFFAGAPSTVCTRPAWPLPDAFSSRAISTCEMCR